MDRLTATNRLNDGGRLLVENPQAADLDAPLTNSIIPQRGVGAVTYTRATIATVIDHEGVIRNCLSGEARFYGARRVRNLFSYSQEFTNAAWVKSLSSVTLHTEAINGLTTYVFAEDTTTAIHRNSQSITFVQDNVYIASFYAKQGTLRYAQIYISGISNTYANFDLLNGVVSAGTTGAGSITALSNGWYRCSLKFSATSSGANAVNLTTITSGSASRASSYLGTGAYFYTTAGQIEDVTGQSIQTVGDYVSTSVLTTAPFHGANVDGVKYFNTTLAGVKIPDSTIKGYLCEASKTNLIVQSNNFSVTWAKNAPQLVITPNAAIGPDGAMSMTKLSPGVGAALQSMVASATVTAAVYAFSVYAKAGENTNLQLLTQGTVSAGYCNFNLATGTVGSSLLWTGVIESMGNGIYRCTAITDTLAAVTGGFHISQVPTSTTGRAGNIDGDGVSGLYVYGTQLELGDFPSSYIPTTAATVTRNIDTLAYNSANAVDSQGAAYIEASLILPGNTVSAVASRFALSCGANGRMFYIGSTMNNANNYDGTTVLASNPGTSMNGNVVKMASSWSGSTKGIYYGSTVPKTSAFDGTMGTGNIDVGASWNGTIRNVRVWRTPPTVAELTSITTL